MATEGIMSLPVGEDMQDEQGAQAPSYVTSADSYDAATTALGRVDPQSLAVLKESLRQNLADLELTPGELDMLIEMFEYMSQRPDQYPQLVQQLIEQDIVDSGDLPEEYDPEFIGAMLAALNEMRLMRVESAMAPMVAGPGAAPSPMPMAKGGLADAAQYLASKGRHGDTMLAHITPEEARMLKSMGGSGTINPDTGLPEFFLKKLVKAVKGAVKGVVNVVKKALQSPIGRVLGTVALAAVLGPTALGMTLGTAGTTALASGVTTLAAGGNIKEALISGAMGYIGGGGTVMGVSPVSAVGQFLPGAAGTALNTGLATGVLGTGVGLVAGMKPADALRMGLVSGTSAAALQGMQNLRGAGGIDSQGNVLSPAEKAVRDDVFRRAMQGDPVASQALQSGDYSAFSGTAPQAQAPMAAADRGIGTARDLLAGQGMRPLTGGQGFQAPEGAFAGPGYSTNLTPPGMQVEGFGLRDPVVTAGGRVDYGLIPGAGSAAAAPAAAPGLIDRAIGGAKDFYNEYLSPSRPGLPADAGLIRKYGPLVAAGTAVVGAAGGMKGKPAEQSPLYDRRYTSDDFMRDNPQLFRGGLDNPVLPPPRGFVPTPSFSTIPVEQIPVSIPSGFTQSPAGVAQPYNVAGLYGVPLVYGPPVGRAKGGPMTMADFPRKNGPINGPGTGTSDSIPAMLSDGEFVFTAKAVRNAGNGSRRKGAARMYKLMKMLEGGQVKGK